MVDQVGSFLVHGLACIYEPLWWRQQQQHLYYSSNSLSNDSHSSPGNSPCEGYHDPSVLTICLYIVMLAMPCWLYYVSNSVSDGYYHHPILWMYNLRHKEVNDLV